jgi:Membrane domain of glycerophosphoryl diester phosphodiesterase
MDLGPTPPPPPPSAGAGGPIQERSLGQILETGWRLYTANAGKLIGVVAVVVVPLALVSALVVEVLSDSDNWFVGLITGTLGFAIGVIISFLIQAAITRAAAAATVGDPVDVEASYRWGLRRLGGIFVVSVLAFLVILGGFILLVIPGVIFSVMLAVCIPAFVVEGKEGTEALSRSWQLVKGNFWHVLFVIVVTGVLTGIVSSVLNSIGGGSFLGSWILGSIAWIVTAPFSALVSILLYVDLRARAERLTGDTLRAELARTA